MFLYIGILEFELIDGMYMMRSFKKLGVVSWIRVSKDVIICVLFLEMLVSYYEEDMKKIVDDLNKWVIDEIGVNFEFME